MRFLQTNEVAEEGKATIPVWQGILSQNKTQIIIHCISFDPNSITAKRPCRVKSVSLQTELGITMDLGGMFTGRTFMHSTEMVDFVWVKALRLLASLSTDVSNMQVIE